MRNVKYNKWIEEVWMANNSVVTQGTGVWEKGYLNDGKFLGWGIDWENTRSGVVNFTVALVELEDGTVERINTEHIKFYNPSDEPSGVVKSMTIPGSSKLPFVNPSPLCMEIGIDEDGNVCYYNNEKWIRYITGEN